MSKYFGTAKQLTSSLLADRATFQSTLRTVPSIIRGFNFAQNWHAAVPNNGEHAREGAAENALRRYFDNNTSGPGIWKWDHYFDIYQRHLGKYVGQEISLVEIGIYSGGSLGMWKTYFGQHCKVIGVDIEEVCMAYQRDDVRVFIGDQADRSFWKNFKDQVPPMDIVIDDGGHTPEQQIVTLEETLTHLRPGGTYICEDVHGIHHDFAAYVSGLASHFNEMKTKPGEALAADPSEFQRTFYSIHLYPYLVVIERSAVPTRQFVAPKHGTEWQPIF